MSLSPLALASALAVSPAVGVSRAATVQQTGFIGCRAYTAKAPVAVSVRPNSIVISCADGNFYVDHLRWSSWAAAAAVATGTAHINNCTPDCAAGHFQSYPLHVRLFYRQACAVGAVQDNHVIFARLSWRFTGAKPANAGNGSQQLACPRG